MAERLAERLHRWEIIRESSGLLEKRHRSNEYRRGACKNQAKEKTDRRRKCEQPSGNKPQIIVLWIFRIAGENNVVGKRSIGIPFLPSSLRGRFKLALCKCAGYVAAPFSSSSRKSCPTSEHACTRAMLRDPRGKLIGTGRRRTSVHTMPTEVYLSGIA